MQGCQQCGGVWLDNASSKRVIDSLCDDTVDKAEAVSRFSQRPADRAATASCPGCQKPLTRWTVPEANVDVDWCDQHGTWFDRDELATVARTYAAKRAYGRSAAIAATGLGAGAVALAASDPGVQERVQRTVDAHGADAVELGAEALSYVDPGDVVDGAGVVAEGAGATFGVLGDILSGLDF